MVVLQLDFEWAQFFDRNLGNRRARFADEMLVAAVSEVVHSPAVPQVNVVDDPSLFQESKSSVDRRAVDRRKSAANLSDKFIGSHVLSRVDHRLGYRKSGCSHPATSRSDQSLYRIEPSLHSPNRRVLQRVANLSGLRAATKADAAAPGSGADSMALTTAILVAPASATKAASSTSMPPIAKKGKLEICAA